MTARQSKHAHPGTGVQTALGLAREQRAARTCHCEELGLAVDDGDCKCRSVTPAMVAEVKAQLAADADVMEALRDARIADGICLEPSTYLLVDLLVIADRRPRVAANWLKLATFGLHELRPSRWPLTLYAGRDGSAFAAERFTRLVQDATVFFPEEPDRQCAWPACYCLEYLVTFSWWDPDDEYRGPCFCERIPPDVAGRASEVLHDHEQANKARRAVGIDDSDLFYLDDCPMIHAVAIAGGDAELAGQWLCEAALRVKPALERLGIDLAEKRHTMGWGHTAVGVLMGEFCAVAEEAGVVIPVAADSFEARP